ncbi:MAG: glycoside hydrolase family 15 protein, partial [Sinobacterium sp.]|nr:glycoside hydrolase family 15 protein [Sinobacterium sp.]
VRNWDYRFCWLRDASMVIKVFTQLGHYRVGSRYLNFILDVIPYKDENVQIMYGIHRQKRLQEETLDWLSGYENSSPVRVGNAAYMQKQHDIYGFVLDTIYQRLIDHPESLENIDKIWTVVRTLVHHVESQWKEPDAGIWEIRGDKKHFVFSKVLCWVAVDRAIKISEFIGQTSNLEGWGELRDEIYTQVISKGWNEDIQSFTQAYGDTHMDASNLLMEHYGMVDANDPKYIATVNRCYDELCRDGLMFRYRNDDDFGEPHSAFTVCTFWMIKSLHRIGRKQLAAEMFEDVLQYTNHLGLLSEDMEFKERRLLGNFPQGYSHLALIDTALALSE